ncbi:Uncharacterised protein [Enterobacter hormaechei]|nr:Uncharacterised protein [Enterobacter hormaechei]
MNIEGMITNIRTKPILSSNPATYKTAYNIPGLLVFVQIEPHHFKFGAIGIHQPICNFLLPKL